MEFLRTIVEGWREHRASQRPMMLTPLDWKADDDSAKNEEPRAARTH